MVNGQLQENHLHPFIAIQNLFADDPQAMFEIEGSTLTLNHVKSPYMVQVEHCTEFGWNVFLKPKENTLPEHSFTYRLYERIEALLNEHSDWEPFQPEIQNRIDLLEEYANEVHKQDPLLIERISRKEPGVIQIHLSHDAEKMSPYVEMGFCRIMNSWYIDFNRMPHEERNRFRQDFFSWLGKIKMSITEWNLSFLKLSSSAQ